MSRLRALKFALVVVAGAFAAMLANAAVDLSTYVRVGRTTCPRRSAAEASAVTYNWDTDTLFVVGDGSTSVVQVRKTGALIDSMALSLGSQPFDDTEGIAYVGGGQFVHRRGARAPPRPVHLRRRTRRSPATRSSASSSARRSATRASRASGYDPLTGGFVAVKESEPLGVFQTGVDFAARHRHQRLADDRELGQPVRPGAAPA